MRIAIIDLGTNTFNLLIAELVNNTYNILVETKYPAKLGKGGINNKTIIPEAFERGITALEIHKKACDDYGVEKIICIATSAIRNAKNGDEFVSQVKLLLGLDIRIIDGEKEAQLIYDGVKQVVPFEIENSIILDIGGGSNEFIIANKDGILWKHSFELGMARMLDRFPPSDPITKDEIKTVTDYYRENLTLLFDALKKYPSSRLVGSSGSFDTIVAMLAAIYHPALDMSKLTTYPIDLEKYAVLHQKYITSLLAERAKMDRMDSHRIEMIVLASIFINFIVEECGITEMVQCSFSLKEGAIHQIINKQL